VWVDVDPAFVITADRLAIVERLRELVSRDLSAPKDAHYCVAVETMADLLEGEIRDAE
jgi:hypothetical protein